MYNLIFTNARGQSVDFTNIADTHILSVSGLEPTTANISEFTTPSLDGVKFANIKRGKRNILINLAQNGMNNADIRKRLYAILGGKVKGVLRVIDNSLDVSVSAIVESITPTQWTEKPTLQISIICESAFFYSTEKKKTKISSVTPLLSFPLELSSEGQEFGQVKNESFMSIDNNGQEKTPCLITLSIIGDVQNPIISNNSIGLYFSLLGDFSNGQKIVINSEVGEKYAKLIDVDGQERDLFNDISISSSWLYVDVGTNNFIVSASSGLDNIVCDIEFNELYYGVD